MIVAARFIAPLLIAAVFVPWLALSGRAGSERGCPVAPISLDQLNAVIAAAPPPSTDEAMVPTSVRPATPQEVAALRGALDAFVACSDTGEPLRVFALYTDRYLGDLLYRQGTLTPERYVALARPEPAAPDERTRLLAVEKVRVLADGRVVGQATIRYAVIPIPKRFVVTIAEVAGVWRIDDILGELTFALP